MKLPAGFLDACKARVPLSRLMGPVVTWDLRRSNAARGDFWACCPFHAERTPSFHVDDRRGFYRCFGCGMKGDHVAWLQQTENCGFRRAAELLAAEAGVPMPDGTQAARPASTFAPSRASEHARDDAAAAARGWERAQRIWAESRPDDGLLMRYLAARGVATEAIERAWGGPPPTLRLHPSLPFYEGTGRGGRPVVLYQGPAMVGLIAGSLSSEAVGVHITWITGRGRACVGRRKLPRKMRGRTGAIAGMPVRLAAERATGRMVVGEGIETTLAWWSHAHLAHLAGRGLRWSAEAALSRGWLAGEGDPRFRARDPATGRWLPSAVPDFARPKWRPPDWVEHLVILGEGSRENPAAAERESWRAQRRHAWRADGTTRRCALIIPPGGWASGLDFADVAKGEAA